MKYVFGTMVAVGFLMVLGAAGNDCNGKCMENAAPIGELLKMVGYGIAVAAAGTFGLLKTN
jgi:hypothetical protein|tara:strand:+ start:504 stop:686 length:183 start_codon:yes stop_codon:yes gene_type:complete